MFTWRLLVRHKFVSSRRLLVSQAHLLKSKLSNTDGAVRIDIQGRRLASTEDGPVNAVTASSQAEDKAPIEGDKAIHAEGYIERPGGTLYSERLRTHQFDTYRLVSTLQSVGYSRPQAVALMKCLRTVLVNGTDFAKSHYLSRGDLENETYLFRAAMSELRSEVKTLRHNEAIAERAEVISLQKELEALNQRTREDLENLRNDVTIEMNNRKIATRAEQQAMEIKIQDLNYNFTKRLADMKTDAEAQKWQTTRLLIVTLVTMIICGLGATRYLLNEKTEVAQKSEEVQTEPSSSEPPTGSDLVTLG